ncbi:MAG TPA: hypothetical protein VNQ77_15035 [Frankiaceae bacterium]|nr:hypothetical protein [Frankiaceae bacterium]
MTTIDDFTTMDHRNRRYLVVPVALVADDAPGRAPDEARWCAHVCDPASPLAGLYAFADTFRSARDAVAETAWSAIAAGDVAKFGLTAAMLAGLYVVATTCEVYEADALSAVTASHAA